MVDHSMGLTELLRKAEGSEDLDFMRETLRFVCQELIDAEAEAVIGAAPYERTSSRTTHRNGSRERTLDTRVGTLELSIPKLRSGSFLPTILEPRRRIERALRSVVCEAYVKGISTRKVATMVPFQVGSESVKRRSMFALSCSLGLRSS